MPHDIHLKVKKEKLGAHLSKKALNKGAIWAEEGYRLKRKTTLDTSDKMKS